MTERKKREMERESMANLIQLSCPRASLDMKEFDRRESVIVILWRLAQHVADSFFNLPPPTPLQPNTHPRIRVRQIKRSHPHRSLLDGPGWNQDAFSVRKSFQWRDLQPSPFMLLKLNGENTAGE